jgi:N-formylglutamate deformylase
MKGEPAYDLHAGTAALVISVPHAGTALPAELAARFTSTGLAVPDTDWHVPLLYAFAAGLGATVLVARQSRYLVDLNRPGDDAALYAGAPSTGLCPVLSFDGEPLYADGTSELPASEIAERRQRWWQPYHDALAAQIERVRAAHGYALLLDAHSIRSTVPRLFDGRLPDLNFGTFRGRSCAPRLRESLAAVAQRERRWTHVFDGRFQGGHITRHYGNPGAGVHAVQLELAQCAYMDETTLAWDAQRAAPLMATLQRIVAALIEFDPRAG